MQKSKKKQEMIFHRALLRELTTNSFAVFFVLLAITFTTLLIRLLGEAASGQVASDSVAIFLAFSMLGYLPVLLSLTLFISILMTITRSYRESEMVVWFSAGMSLLRWIRPVASFALPMILLISALSLVIVPWSVQKTAELKRQIESRDEVSTVAPGVFKESKQADRVYFVESFAGDLERVRNIFMQSLQHQKLGIVVAKNGYQESAPNGDRFLVLLNGRRYEGTAGSPEYRILEFESYATRIEPFESKAVTVSAKSLPTPALIRQQTPGNKAELVWRVGLPVSAALLALLAIPLSFVNPRAGRSLNLVLALLFYLVYNNFVSISQAWVGQERISLAVGMWSVHAGMLVLVLFMFYRRVYSSRSLL
jgi:lipopolysaccharide export system permease protein